MTLERTSSTPLTLLRLQRITDGGDSSLVLYGKVELEKLKGQMKEAFILQPDSPHSPFRNVHQLSLPFMKKGITESVLESFANWYSLFKLNQSIVQIKRKQIISSSNGIVLQVIVD